MEGTISEIRGFGPNWAPRAWSLCEGQTLAISQNTALFSLIGTIYGGDGRTTFQLPDLRGRTPIGQGTGPGLSPRRNGETVGQETHTLTINEIPSHNHSTTTSGLTINAIGTAKPKYSQDLASDQIPKADQVPGAPQTNSFGPGDAIKGYVSNANTVDGAEIPVAVSGSVSGSVSINNTGGSRAHSIMQPSLVISWIICLQGIFPSRN